MVKNDINPNRGGPTASVPDTLSPRFNHRGRAESNSVGTFKDRLRDQVEHGEAHEMAISPEIDTKAVIQPSQELLAGWPCMKGLEFGGGE